MKRLLPVLFGFALLLLSSTEGWSADFKKKIILGTSSYHNMKSTVKLLIKENNVKAYRTLVSLDFQHSLKVLPDKQVFSLSFLGCKDIDISHDELHDELKVELKKVLEFCSLAEDTNLVITNFNPKNIYNYELSHPSYGTAEIRFDFKSDTIKSEGEINLRNIPIGDQYYRFHSKVSLSELVGDFQLQNGSGEKKSGKASISDGKFNFYVPGEPKFDKEVILDQQQINMLSDFRSVYEELLKIKNSAHYFGGMPVHQGEIFKKDILSIYNKLDPSPVKSFKVIGKRFYRGREVVILKTIFDMDFLRNNIKYSRTDPLSTDMFLYIDRNTGTPVYIDLNFDFVQSKEESFKFKLEMNTDFSSAIIKTTKDELNKSNAGDITTRLKKLKELEDQGLITKEDAARKRKEILESL